MAMHPLSPFRSGGGLFASDPFLSLHREMNRLFDDTFRNMGSLSAGIGQGEALGNLIPAHMNVSETDNEIHVTAELPGVTEKDIDIKLDEDILTIRGEKKMEQKEEKENYYFAERSYGTFQRSLRLPYPVDPDKVEARFENGVLTVTLPKSERQERSRHIQVQSGNGRQIGESSSSRQGSKASSSSS